MNKTLINCVGDLVNDDQFSLHFLQPIELTSYLVKVGFQNRCAKDIKLAVDEIHKNSNGKLPDNEIKLWSIHEVGQKLMLNLEHALD